MAHQTLRRDADRPKRYSGLVSARKNFKNVAGRCASSNVRSPSRRFPREPSNLVCESDFEGVEVLSANFANSATSKEVTNVGTSKSLDRSRSSCAEGWRSPITILLGRNDPRLRCLHDRPERWRLQAGLLRLAAAVISAERMIEPASIVLRKAITIGGSSVDRRRDDIAHMSPRSRDVGKVEFAIR